jgi:hypothetical protein
VNITKENREDKLLKAIEYNKKNEAELKQKFKCECGGKYTKASRAIHCKTKRHQKYILNNNTNIEI